MDKITAQLSLILELVGEARTKAPQLGVKKGDEILVKTKDLVNLFGSITNESAKLRKLLAEHNSVVNHN